MDLGQSKFAVEAAHQDPTEEHVHHLKPPTQQPGHVTFPRRKIEHPELKMSTKDVQDEAGAKDMQARHDDCMAGLCLRPWSATKRQDSLRCGVLISAFSAH